MSKKYFFLCCICATFYFSFHIYLKKYPSSEDIDQMRKDMSQYSMWINRIPRDFELETTEGKIIHLSDNIGKKIIIINFFASWCGPCNEEMPRFIEFYKKNRDSVEFIAVSADQKKEELDHYLKNTPLPFHIVSAYYFSQGENKKIAKYFGIKSIPVTIAIGVNGKIELYERGGILNTDVAFSKLLKMNILRLQKNMNISEKSYKESEKFQENPNWGE